MGVAALPLASSIEPPTSPAAPARRMVSAALSGESLNPLSRSAATGSRLTQAISWPCASACSRVIWPSRRPSVAAQAELEVASALKPSSAMTAAEPPSQTLGMTNAPAAACSARNRVARSRRFSIECSRLPGVFLRTQVADASVAQSCARRGELISVNPPRAVSAHLLLAITLCAAGSVNAAPLVCARNPQALAALSHLRSALRDDRFVSYEPTTLKVWNGVKSPAD